MSIFASRTQKTIPIPFDAPHEVTIQKLAGRHLEKAAQEHQIETQSYVARMGGAEYRKQLNAVGDSEEVAKQVAALQADPMFGYHRPTLIKFGVKAWTYDELITDATIEDLDDQALEFFSREVLKLSKPSAFQTKDEAETERKNVTGSSTAT